MLKQTKKRDNSKKHGCNMEKTICVPPNSFQCSMCGRSMTNRSSYYRHKRIYCKQKQSPSSDGAIAQIRHLQEELEELRSEVKELREQPASINIQQNIQQNTIFLVAPGREGTDWLDQLPVSVKHEILACKERSIPVLTQYRNFNDALPAFRNIRRTNLRSNDVDVFDPSKRTFVKKLLKPVVKDLVAKGSHDVMRVLRHEDSVPFLEERTDVREYHNTVTNGICNHLKMISSMLSRDEASVNQCGILIELTMPISEQRILDDNEQEIGLMMYEKMK